MKEVSVCTVAANRGLPPKRWVCDTGLPEVYRAVPHARPNAPNHLVDADFVDIVCRDNLESDDLFILCEVGFTLRVANASFSWMMRGVWSRLSGQRRTLILHRMPACTFVLDRRPSSRAM